VAGGERGLECFQCEVTLTDRGSIHKQERIYQHYILLFLGDLFYLN
jgi:hypothetical protein